MISLQHVEKTYKTPKFFPLISRVNLDEPSGIFTILSERYLFITSYTSI